MVDEKEGRHWDGIEGVSGAGWAQRVEGRRGGSLSESSGLQSERDGNDGVDSGKEENDENPDGDEGFLVVC